MFANGGQMCAGERKVDDGRPLFQGSCMNLHTAVERNKPLSFVEGRSFRFCICWSARAEERIERSFDDPSFRKQTISRFNAMNHLVRCSFNFSEKSIHAPRRVLLIYVFKIRSCVCICLSFGYYISLF